MKKAVAAVENHSMSNAVLQTDPFLLFDLEPNFQIDKNLVEDKYIELQQMYHPDRFVNADMTQQLKAQQIAADLNQAYAILLDPVKRGAALLAREGVVCEVNQEKTISDPQLLMEVIEMRERIEDLKTAEGHAAFMQSLDQEIDLSQKNADQSYKEKKYEKTRFYILKLRYLLKTSQELKKLNFQEE